MCYLFHTITCLILRGKILFLRCGTFFLVFIGLVISYPYAYSNANSAEVMEQLSSDDPVIIPDDFDADILSVPDGDDYDFMKWSSRRKIHWKQDKEWLEIERKEMEYQEALATKEFHESKDYGTNLLSDLEQKERTILNDKSDILNHIKRVEKVFTAKDRLVLYVFTDTQLASKMQKINDRLLSVNYPIAFALEPNQLVALDIGDKKGENFYRLHMLPLKPEQLIELYINELSRPVKVTLRTREPVPGRVVTDYIATNNLDIKYNEIIRLYDSNPLVLRGF